MPLPKLLVVVRQNIRRNRKNFLFSSFGIFVGTATLIFFIALGQGISTRVVNKMFPEDLLEIVPRRYKLAQTQIQIGARMDEDTIEDLKKLPGVLRVYPKQRSKFQARLWGGAGTLLGRESRRDLHTEAFFDGIDPTLIRPDLARDLSSDGKLRDGQPCKQKGDCATLGTYCNAKKRCEFYWKRFRDWENLSCKADADCPFSRSCVAGQCQAQSCETADPWDKPEGQCPSGTYCAITNLGERTPAFTLRGLWPVVDDYYYHGQCEGYIPVVISPYLFEIFNTIAAPTLGLPRIDKQAVLGLRGGLHFGASYMKSNYSRARQTLRRVELIGFSSKAIDLGLTMPLAYVKRFNERYRKMIGEERLSQYDSVILELRDKRSMPMLLARLQKMEYTLSSKSQQGAEIRNFIFIITVVFGMISVLILTISAVNITHTFLMIVSERKREIGILRSIGASKNDIRQIILTEAAGIGLLGGGLGLASGFGLSRLCNFLFARYIPYFPYKPDNFFEFDGALIAGALVFALVFCLLGAFLPANRATKLDPASALTVH